MIKVVTHILLILFSINIFALVIKIDSNEFDFVSEDGKTSFKVTVKEYVPYRLLNGSYCEQCLRTKEILSRLEKRKLQGRTINTVYELSLTSKRALGIMPYGFFIVLNEGSVLLVVYRVQKEYKPRLSVGADIGSCVKQYLNPLSSQVQPLSLDIPKEQTGAEQLEPTPPVIEVITMLPEFKLSGAGTISIFNDEIDFVIKHTTPFE